MLPSIVLRASAHCEFCNEFSGGSSNSFSSRYGALTQRHVFQTAHFCIFPSLGQITCGHLLITPVRHHCALADLHGKRLDELEGIICHVRTVLAKTYGECVFFEHGIRGAGSGGCGIDHAHMHALPITANGVLDILMREFGGCAINDLADVKEAVRQEASYLFFEDASASRYVFSVKELPSQYMRKLVAESIGKCDWDWRNCGQEPELLSTLERLTPLLSPAAIVAGEWRAQDKM